jgi:YD repeat-containing protein
VRGTPSSESGLAGSIAVPFDAYGDQASAGTRSYTYDALGRLTADTATSSGTGYQFSYAGATGTIASDGASTYTWDPSGSVLAGVGAAGGGSGVLALTSVHGDVLGQFGASGTGVSGSQSYDPWGKVTAATGTSQALPRILWCRLRWVHHYPAAEQRKCGAAVHLPFDRFDLIYDALYLA